MKNFSHFSAAEICSVKFQLPKLHDRTSHQIWYAQPIWFPRRWGSKVLKITCLYTSANSLLKKTIVFAVLKDRINMKILKLLKVKIRHTSWLKIKSLQITNCTSTLRFPKMLTNRRWKNHWNCYINIGVKIITEYQVLIFGNSILHMKLLLYPSELISQILIYRLKNKQLL